MKRNTTSEMLQILDALKQGKAVQVWNDEYQNWIDTDKSDNSHPPDFFNNRYRIKPAQVFPHGQKV